MAQKYQGVVISGGDPDGFSMVFYAPLDRLSYDEDLKAGGTEDGEKIIASDWLRTPVDLEKIDRFATTLIARMRNVR